MMKRLRGASRQQGATLYEFAAILPIILFLMVGIIDFGRAMYAYHFVSSAARAATRWASVRGADCNPTYTTHCPAEGSDILAYVQTLAPPGMYVNGTAGCTTATVGCLTINCPTCTYLSANASTGIWPGTTSTSGVSTTCQGSGTATVPPNNPGCVVQVTVEYTFGFGVPLFGNGNNLILASTSEMVISQ
ncbi:MAG: TadE/TadG family type IV pilus assembly protein [Candidatus Acidiferrales bacterium]|jgi:Flp pilus assembly protein TadG